MSGAMDKIKAKVENVLHKDKSHNDDPTGPHSSHSGNKADPRVDSDHVGSHGNTTHGTTGGLGSTTHGTTGTTGGLSDTTHSHGTTGGLGSNTHGTTGGLGSTTHGTTGGLGSTTHGTTGGLGGSNTYGSDPTGPHDSHLSNKADPRVDSDRVGGYGNTTSGLGANSSGLTGTGTHGTSGLAGSNTHGTTGGLGGNTYGSDPTGPHGSHLANQADPRVGDAGYGNTSSGLGGHSSGLTGSGAQPGLSGTGTHGHSSGLAGSNTHGTTGGLGGSNTYGSDPTGTHDSRLGNKADPRIDSTTAGGYGNTSSTGGYGAGSHTGAGVGGVGGFSSNPGPAENTAGPHKSDMLNKADPRVDSNLDGSKTYGGDKTYQGDRPSGY